MAELTRTDMNRFLLGLLGKMNVKHDTVPYLMCEAVFVLLCIDDCDSTKSIQPSEPYIVLQSVARQLGLCWTLWSAPTLSARLASVCFWESMRSGLLVCKEKGLWGHC